MSIHSLTPLRAAVFLTALALAGWMQWIAGSYNSDFDGQQDEPAHVVSSLLVRDYLAHGLPHNPLSFAREYYAHFPKVAIGHWPPFFHATEASWMLVFGRSKTAMFSLLAVLAASLTAAMFAWTRRDCSVGAALFAAMAILVSPLVQISITIVMPDILLGLLAFGAAASTGAFLETKKKRYAVWFAVFALAAVSTNGRGIAIVLLIVPTGAILARRDWRWHAGLFAMIVLFLLPSIVARVYPFSFRGMFGHLWQFVYGLAVLITWPVITLAGIGAVSIFRNRQLYVRWVPMLGLFFSAFLFHGLLNWPLEDRYLITAAPAVAALAAAGCRACFKNIWPIAICAVIAIAFDVRHFSKKDDLGYHRFASESLAQRHPTSLIVGDPFHEGAFIAEMDLIDARPVHTILRGSKTLSSSTWAGHNYKLRFSSAHDAGVWLDSTDVTLVVVQRTSRLPDLAQLLEWLNSDTAIWHELPTAQYPKDVRVFERRHD